MYKNIVPLNLLIMHHTDDPKLFRAGEEKITDPAPLDTYKLNDVYLFKTIRWFWFLHYKSYISIVLELERLWIERLEYYDNQANSFVLDSLLSRIIKQ